MDDNYQDLANGIVVQAAKDYRKALKRLMKFPSSNSAKREIKQLEVFFGSDYYKLLTSLDGELLIERLKQELEDEMDDDPDDGLEDEGVEDDC